MILINNDAKKYGDIGWEKINLINSTYNILK